MKAAKKELEKNFTITIPQSRPLSAGEILGCTSPNVTTTAKTHDNHNQKLPIILYLGDGRFHLESIMIANPSLLSYRYDPYAKSFTRESYDHKSMRELRSHAITQLASAETVGVILGTAENPL